MATGIVIVAERSYPPTGSSADPVENTIRLNDVTSFRDCRRWWYLRSDAGRLLAPSVRDGTPADP